MTLKLYYIQYLNFSIFDEIIKMKFLFYFLLLFVTSCSTTKYPVEERSSEINLIIEEIINSEKILFTKGTSNNKIISNLKDPDIFFSKKALKHGIAPIDHLGVPNIKLLKLESDEKSFTKSDYQYLNYQYHKLPNEIHFHCKHQYTCITQQKLDEDKKLGNLYDYYQFSLPIFSKDHTTAFVELNYQSGGIYGDGTAYLLKKRYNKWVIVGKWGTWIS